MLHDLSMNKLNVKECVLGIRVDDGEIFEQGEEICEVMNDRNRSLFSNEDTETPEMDGNLNGQMLDETDIVEEDIAELL